MDSERFNDLMQDGRQNITSTSSQKVLSTLLSPPLPSSAVNLPTCRYNREASQKTKIIACCNL